MKQNEQVVSDQTVLQLRLLKIKACLYVTRTILAYENLRTGSGICLKTLTFRKRLGVLISKNDCYIFFFNDTKEIRDVNKVRNTCQQSMFQIAYFYKTKFFRRDFYKYAYKLYAF